MRCPLSGLKMYMCACAGLRSAATFTVRCASWLILFSAEASASGSPEISAPSLSASYSRVRLTAICTSAAAIGATITAMQHADRTERVVARIAAAEEQAELRQHRDGAGKGRRDGHGQRVAALDMRQFVRNHGGDFARLEIAQQARRHGDRGVLRVAAGGEGVGLLGVDDIEPGRRDAGALRQRLDHVVEVGRERGSTRWAFCMRSTILSEFQ